MGDWTIVDTPHHSTPLDAEEDDGKPKTDAAPIGAVDIADGAHSLPAHSLGSADKDPPPPSPLANAKARLGNEEPEEDDDQPMGGDDDDKLPIDKEALKADVIPGKVTRVSLALETDATGSLASHVRRMQTVFKTLLAVCKEVREENDGTEIVFDITIGAMRDWDQRKVYELYLMKAESIKAGHVVPFSFSGADDEYATILAAIDKLAESGCYGGADAPEDYFPGVAVAREFCRKQREEHGPHPQFVLFLADDAHHGFCDHEAGDSYAQGTGHMPMVNHETYNCPYAPTKNPANGVSMWRGGNALAELGKMLDEGVYAVWCAVGNASKTYGSYNKWLTALTSCMDKTEERTGFVFQYDADCLSEQDLLKVPSTIATLFLQQVKCMSVPIMEDALKRQDLIGKQVDATLQAAAGRIRREGKEAPGAAAALEGGVGSLIDNLDNLAAISSLEPSETLKMADAAESEDPDAMRSLGAEYRSLASSKPHRMFSAPTPSHFSASPVKGWGADHSDTRSMRKYSKTGEHGVATPTASDEEDDDVYHGLSMGCVRSVPSGAPKYRSLSAAHAEAEAEVNGEDGEGDEEEMPVYRSASAATSRSVPPAISSDPGFDRKAALRNAIGRHVSFVPPVAPA